MMHGPINIKYVSICSNSQAAKTTSPSEQECQKAVNDTSTHHTAGLFWVAGHSGVQGNETANRLTRNGTVQKFVGPEPAFGVPRQNIRRKIKSWRDNQHMVMWWGLIITQRQAQKLILGPSPTANTRLLSFNRTQYRVVTCLLTGHNTPRIHHHLMGLT